MSNFSDVLKQFSPITLSEMKSVTLMNRVDTKFIFHKHQLKAFLSSLSQHYRILEINHNPISGYKNLYFDTPKLKFYRDHHNGKRNRMKIRIREYVETDVCFIEVKQKSNTGQTNKKRLQLESFENRFSGSTTRFIDQFITDSKSLQPVLWTEFNRITLVSLENQERITIDMGLGFNNNGKTEAYDDLIIVELKQAVFNRNTYLFKILKSMQINPYRISKYCIGMAVTTAGLKQNAFKEKVLKINKITR